MVQGSPYKRKIYHQDGDVRRGVQSTHCGMMTRGQKQRSSSEVEHALRARGLISDTAISETEAETGGETSEYGSSPVKMPQKQDV